MEILTEHSLAYLLLCVALGAIYGLILYYKNKKEEFTKQQNMLLFIFRSVAVTLIAFFLLNPLVKSLKRHTEKPFIIFAQDNSASVLMNPDSTFYSMTYPDAVSNLLEKLNNDFDVHSYSFGENINSGLPFTFTDKLTNIGEWFRYAQSTFYNRHVGAMILASDGLYNAGINPLYAMDNINYPVYTVAIGDTTAYKDIIVERINYNRVVFLNNRFPVEVLVNARKAKGETAHLSISIDNQIVETKEFQIDDENFSKTFSFMFMADAPGKRRITASLKPLEGEINIANNTATVFIDVIDSRHKILLLYNAPHPDILAVKSAIETNVNYEIEHHNARDFIRKPLEPYSLVILHNLPSQEVAANYITRQIQEADVPALYIIGAQTNISLFNQLNTGLHISGTRGGITEAMPQLNNNFTLFTLNDNAKAALQRFPPLYSPFGQYNVAPTAQVFLFQRIGAVVTEQPLITFNEIAGKKTAVIAGENFWRWRMADFARNDNHNASHEIIQKIVQYLALRVDKERFRVRSKDVFYENENIVFEAEVYNESFELINNDEVRLLIKSSDGATFNYVFSKTANAYTLDAGRLPVGSYTYEAFVNVGANLFRQNGAFYVEEVNIESLNTIANHRLMFNMAMQNNAEMFYPENLDDLYQHIIDNQDIKPVIYQQTDFTELLNLPWLLFLIVALLATEWFVRKWVGSY